MMKRKVKENNTFQPIGEMLSNFNSDKNKYFSEEFQDFGYRLAEELGDLPHKALYIKMAKQMPREILENAKNFVKDARNVRSKGSLFMWKVNQLKEKK